MPLQATSGAASYDGFGGGVVAEPNYIESCFSTYLYNGGSPPKTITNGIDLSGKGGLTWIKSRNLAESHRLVDTVRGATKALYSNATDAQVTEAAGLTAFTSSGFTVNYDSGYCGNTSTDTYASWTFRKQPKFFDVVTYTGTGTNRTVSHNLGSVPGCIITKKTSATGEWLVYHRGQDNYAYTTRLNSTAGQGTLYTAYSATPTSTQFSVDGDLNDSGGTYVAYLFAHNAGGFGLTGTDNVISCGSYTGNGTSLQSINLGYEPQLVLIKSASIAGTEWAMLDNMRGVATGGVDAVLNPNTSGAEASPFDRVDFTSTGFNLKTSSSIYNETGTYIYIAIRRGPMKVPTSGTSVFAMDTASGTAPNPPLWNSGWPVDWGFYKNKTSTNNWTASSRLIQTNYLSFNLTNAEASSAQMKFDYMDGWQNDTSVASFLQGWMFRRAPSFFDEVCYTGTGVARTVTHNLGVAPELMIVKTRSSASTDWKVYSSSLGNNKQVYLNYDYAVDTPTNTWNNTTPTSSVFSVGGSGLDVNNSGQTYVAYLFATCAGVSKVGSYTGNGSNQTINCGFTGGARFVLIKRTDSTGDWYVWDSARGIVAGNDPYLRLNTTAAQVTSTDYIDTYSAGFEISSTAPAAINASGGTYIFLAIA